MLGGGLKAGRLVEVFGDSKAGKTQLAMQAVMYTANQGYPSLFLDTEGTFRPERLEKMAAARGWDTQMLLSKIAYLRVTDSTQQVEVVRRMEQRDKTRGSRLVAVDTLTRNFQLDYPGGTMVATRQGALNAHLGEMARDAFLHGRAYLLTNLVTFLGAGETHIGGATVSQLVHDSIHLIARGATISASSERTGRSATMTIGQGGVD